MSRFPATASRLALTLTAAGALAAAASPPLHAQAAPGATQAIDEAYTAKIREYLSDPRISTELVDHLPASSTVPTPLDFHGRIVGTPEYQLMTIRSWSTTTKLLDLLDR